MSASQDKKRRQEQRSEGTDKRTLAQREAEKKAKKERVTWTVIGVIVAVLAILVILVSSNLFYTGTTAVTVGDYKYTNADVEYMYQLAYENIASSIGEDNMSYILDTSSPLDSQTVSPIIPLMYGMGIPDSLVDAESYTWQDYFLETAKENIRSITAVYDAAVKDGYTLTDEDKANIDSQISTLGVYAQLNGYSAKEYMALRFGKGVGEKTVRKMMERSLIASSYLEDKYNGMEYTQEQLDEYFAANEVALTQYSYTYYLVNGKTETVTETTVNEETGEETTSEKKVATEATMAAAKETAEAIAAAVRSGESMEDAILDQVKVTEGESAPTPTSNSSVYGSSVSTVLRDWVTHPVRVEGAVTVIESADNGYYVVRFDGRDETDYELVSARHILIMAEDSDGDGAYSDSELASAYEEAEKIKAEWEDGDATEDSFAALANQYSEDTGSNTTGGLYEHIFKGQMVENFNNFCFDENRQPGDVDIVLGSSSNYTGYHIIYFVGAEEGYTLRDYRAEYGNGSSLYGLHGEEYQQWRTELEDSMSLRENSFVLSFAKL